MPRCSSTTATAAAKHKQRPGNGRRTVAVTFGNVRSSPCQPHGSQTTVLQAHGEVGHPLPQRFFPGTHCQGRIQITGRSLQGTPRHPSHLLHNDLCPESGSSRIHHRRPVGAWNDLRTLSRIEGRENRLCMLTATAGTPQAVPGTTWHPRASSAHTRSPFLPQTLLS